MEQPSTPAIDSRHMSICMDTVRCPQLLHRDLPRRIFFFPPTCFGGLYYNNISKESFCRIWLVILMGHIYSTGEVIPMGHIIVWVLRLIYIT